MKTLIAPAMLVALLAPPALAMAASVPAMKTSASEGEKAATTFFVEDSVGDVQLGKLGLQKAVNAPVRALAAAMVRDHTRTANAGMQVAKTISDDEVRFKAGDDNQIALSHLARYSGNTFDREYVSALIDAHESDIKTAKDVLEYAKTPALRAYLQKTISTDERHLAMAKLAQQAEKGA